MSSEVIFRRIFNNEYTLRKITEIELDDVFGNVEDSYTDYTIMGIVIPITLEDIRFTLPGKLQVGDARGYFYSSYLIGVERVTIETGDKIFDDTIEYNVDSITRYRWGELEFREAYLRREV